MQQLRKLLQQIDGKGYKAYKSIQGTYRFGTHELAIDAVQGDPFASPSKIRLIIPRKSTSINVEQLQTRERKITTEDLAVRKVHQAILKSAQGIKGSGKSGLVAIDAPGQEVLERTAVTIDQDSVEICLSIGLPAQGRRVLGKQAEKIFFTLIPNVLKASVFALQEDELNQVSKLADQQQAIRTFIKENHYIAFIANGSVLPRESGVSQRPLKKGKVVPFQSPEEMKVSIDIPHQQEPIKGMGIPKGITLIVGGGFHGKSTMLEALETGVYDHIAGDGREYVITNNDAVKIRSEDGRSVTKVDISPFINDLPYGKDTTSFTSENASGSTSQAANIMEALEAGAGSLLIDEDTSATNFMIRDARMQALVSKSSEPITPFLDKVRQLYEEQDVSTVLVMGGAGDYFDVADQIIKMEQYQPVDATSEAKAIAENIVYQRQEEGGQQFGDLSQRTPLPSSLNSKKGKRNKVATRGKHTVQYGTATISLHHVEQLADDSQTRMIADILQHLERTGAFKKDQPINEWLDIIEKQLNQSGLSSFTTFKGHPGDLARPRRFEIAAALNRHRGLNIK